MTFDKLTVIRSYEFGIMALGILTLRTTIKNAKLSITALLTHILSVILLSVANEPIMLNVIMLSVVAPVRQPSLASRTEEGKESSEP